MEHRILLFLLVPHSSHLTQPLDATVFGSLKRILSGIVNPMFQLGVTKIQKPEWLEAYYEAHLRAFSVKTIKAGFSSTGIYPFNPNKALNRIRPLTNSTSVTSLYTPVPQTPTSISTEITTPFTNQILTSSSSDFSVFKAANSALNCMIESMEPLSTPVCQYIRCVTSAAEKLFTRTSILQEWTEAQEALLAARQQRALGKRSILKGKSLISTPEIHADLIRLKSRKQKKGTSSDLLY